MSQLFAAGEYDGLARETRKVRLGPNDGYEESWAVREAISDLTWPANLWSKVGMTVY